MARLARLDIPLASEQRAELDALAEASGVSATALGRLGIVQLLARQELIMGGETGSRSDLDASRRMKGVHVVQPFAEAARRHGDLDYVWEVPLDSFRAHAAFVSRHASEYAPFGAICKRHCKLSIGGEYDRATVG